MKRNNFTLLRLSLAALVIVSHSWPLLFGLSHLDPSAALLGHQADLFGGTPISLGRLAVDAFFAISGYLITLSYLRRPSLPDYLRRRVLRIYPGFVVAVLLCAFVVAPLLGAPVSLDGFGVLLLSPRLPDVALPVVSINGSLWTIPYEFGCYLLVPPVVWLFRHWRFAPAALFALVFAWYCLLLTPYTYQVLRVMRAVLPLTPAQWPILLCFFLGGLCCAVYAPRFTPLRLWLAAAVLLASCVVSLLPLALPLLLPYLVLGVALVPRLPRIDTDLSYGVYLYGFPIQQLLIAAGVHGPLLLTVCALPLALFCGVLSWYAIERPFLRLKARYAV